jgi:hypothetical protein
MIRILLCCEGPTDQGRKGYLDGEYINSSGVMQILIQKTSLNTNLDFVVKTRQDIKAIRNKKKYLNKQEQTSIRLALLAKQEDCTHIAYHRDEDNKGLDEKYKEVQEYFADARRKEINCLAIVPMRMTESWLLADKDAFPSKPINPKLPVKPEEIWGNKGADTHPKKCIERVLRQFHLMPCSEVFSEIAEKSSIETLRARCPESFGQFYNDMQTFIPQGAGTA